MPLSSLLRPKLAVQQTVDRFIAAVPWGKSRRVLVFRREHGGRTFVRLRTWNRHRKLRKWYPTVRFFVIPVEHAAALAGALIAAADGQRLHRKPRWYAERERADHAKYESSLILDVLTEGSEKRRRRRNRWI